MLRSQSNLAHTQYNVCMKRLLKITTILGLFAASAGLLVFCAVVLYLNPKLPSVDVLKESNLQVPLRIYSQNGTLIGEYGEQFRTPVSRDDLPETFVQALLAAEDDRFLQHGGIDIAGLIRAATELVRTGSIQTGGSTITMQVARNYFLTSEQTFIRKFKEILLALKIEQAMSKDEILELYVNKIYLGKRAYGVQAAAAIYYGTTVKNLDLAQIAMIAGLPKAPSSFNPVNNPDRAVVRRNWILGRMLKLGFIEQDSYESASQQPITAKYHGPKLQLDAGYPAEMARRFITERLGELAYKGGYKVITTIDDRAQIDAETAVRRGLSAYSQRHGYRGPELRLANLSTEEQITQLKSLAPVGGIYPALVLGFDTAIATDNETSKAFTTRLQLQLPTDEIVELDWRADSQEIRRYLSEDRRSGPVKKIEELLRVGDIIRISQNADKLWQIDQLPEASASLVALDPSNGAILAISGGFDHKLSQFNRASQAFRQPGSNFKPFIYAAALENNFTAASIINDAPIVFSDDNLESDWRPENASGKFHGPTTLRKALYKSRNLVSVRLLRELGIDTAIRYLDRFGLSGGKLPRDLSLALGSYSLTPLETAGLYATLANGGFKVEPFLVKEIRDRKNRLVYAASPTIACSQCKDDDDLFEYMGLDDALETEVMTSDQSFDAALEEAASLEEILEQNQSSDSHNEISAPKPRLAKRVIREEVAFIVDDILRDVIDRGTGTKAKSLGRDDIAGKTGTTNGPTDAWFSGYHPQLVATSWLGFDDNSNIGKREFGGTAALPIWMDFMEGQLKKLEYAQRSQPPGVLAIKIDTETGELASASTKTAEFEFFIEGSVPEQISQSDNRAVNFEMEAIEEDLF